MKEDQLTSEVRSKDLSIAQDKEVLESIQDDFLRVFEGPALEDVRMLLNSTDQIKETIHADLRNQSEECTTQERMTQECVACDTEASKLSPKTVLLIPPAKHDDPAPEAQFKADAQSSLAVAVDADSPVRQDEAESCPLEIPPPEVETAPPLSPGSTFSPVVPELSSPRASVGSPRIGIVHAESQNPHSKGVSTNKIRTPGVCNQTNLCQRESLDPSPQIGTSLLRRESLRRKESPSNKRSLRKTRRETLQRRDTLQEREILRGVIAQTNAEQSIEDFDHGVKKPLPPHAKGSSVEASEENFESASCDVQITNETAKSDIKDSNSAPNEDTSEIQDLHRAREVELHETSHESQACRSTPPPSNSDIQASQATDAADESFAKITIDQATQALEDDQAKIHPSNRKTRSGTRFSDDTSMLKEFLNRAQAKKAAKGPVSAVPDLPKPQISPRRSPRKALESLTDRALSPQKARDVPNCPETPPSKPKVDPFDSDDGEEISTETVSCRRSTRTRLPAPSKGVPGAPSFIPIRRADGTDPVVLQKSQAQELAMVTRANTRRNKGQSKPPLLALQDLSAEITGPISTSTVKRRAIGSKIVGWAEQLASYQDAKEAEEAEEMRPKVRRMRSLGAANNNTTPGPKRTTAVVSTSNGTPAPKRRGKAR